MSLLLLESGVDEAMSTGKVKLRDRPGVGEVLEFMEPVARDVADVRGRKGGSRRGKLEMHDRWTNNDKVPYGICIRLVNT